jgi:hypothetical protein
MNDQKIRERAYAIWAAAGRPHGREKEHWLQAERELAAKKPKRQARPKTANPGARSKKTTLKVVAG